MASEPLSYVSYLKINELLALQEPKSDGPEHDELLFIVIHQTYELWFKQILHELDRARRLLREGSLHPALG
ncbi:MAG: tryptophan 2,3-dioxygenase family protein, partial [Actinomycetota bacterium]